jgi:Do/DeqQ family serine protease
MNKNLIFSGLIALVVSISSIGVYSYLNKDSKVVKIEHINSTPGQSANYQISGDGTLVELDFNKTAEKVISGVVHIKSTQIFNGNSQEDQFRNIPDPFKDFFGDDFERFFGPQFRFKSPDNSPRSNMPPTRVGAGSGVIISEDGYIVTNNHVINYADDIEVTLHDNRTYKATVIGTDPSTDLALIQIKEKNLPTLQIADSDDVHIGQWVMAVGNPMGLNSTVTAGIVSAKGRNINILKDRYAVENFIQTDAAINPGNSGGALVNLNGGLVGINTAIASPTGTFAGYGFAIPANIVNKVVKDLLEFGVVQRGVLGVMIRTLDGNLAKDKDLNLTQGVYIDSLMENSAAGKAGIEVGDIILSVNGTEVKTSPELQGIIARHRPGESVDVKVDRKGKTLDFSVILNNREGDVNFSTKDNREIIKVLGADFEEIDKSLAKKLEIPGGVKVKKLYAGKLGKYTHIREGFIITKIDGKSIESVDDLVKMLDTKKGGVMLEGVYEDIPGEYYYAFGL